MLQTLVNHLVKRRHQKSGQWLRHIIIYLILFTLLAKFVDIWRGKDLPKQQIPTTKIESLNGQQIDLNQDSFKQITLIYFWATWCGPCRLTTPSVNKLSQNFSVVSIAMASGNDQLLSKYKVKNKLEFPVVNDHNQQLSQQWGVNATPVILIIKNNKIIDYSTGISSYPILLLRIWWAKLKNS